MTRLFSAALLLALTVMAGSEPPVATAETTPGRFASVEEGFGAMVNAVKAHDQKTLLEVLGPDARSLVYSGDAVADRAARQRFVDAYDQAHHVEGGGGKVVLYVGRDDFPFPIPLVPDGPYWRFDAKAGAEEVLNRRIGENELAAIQVCLAYVDAQKEYYSEDRNADGLREYAQRFASSSGKRDGLFWETKPGAPPSPLGPLVVHARAEGYVPGGAEPYHGYFYRILTAQGPDAPGGESDYVAHGHMIGGFGLVAFPAHYGLTGVMTFTVNHDGVVYQKDLGPRTAAIAGKMRVFNPDGTWKKP
jgi:hypothetical protein